MPDNIRERAIEWHDRLRRDSSSRTRQEFEQWRAQNPEHAREFDQQALLDDHIKALGMGPSTVGAATPPARRAWLPIGATALAAALALVFLNLPGTRQLPGLPATGAGTPLGLTTPMRLEDGTIVLLAAYTRVEEQFDPGLRRIRLTGGAARFILASDPVRPVLVEAAGLEVRAAAGVFDVDMAPGGPRVTAVHGALEVRRVTTPNIAPVAVAAGQSIAVGDGKLSPTPAALLHRVLMIEANSLSLGDLLRAANSLGGVEITLADAGLANRHLVGRFDISDHHLLARKIAAALDLTLVDRASAIILANPEKISGP